MNLKILIADDDYDNRMILKEALEMAGWRVLQATNGLEAFELIMAERPALVFLDLSMPKMNGWEVAKKIREMPELADVAVFAFTAHALQGDETKARAAGCDDYIAKPCIPRDVVKKVRRWLQEKSEVEAHG